MNFRLVTVAALAAAIASPAPAQKVDNDVRCMLLSNVFARSEKDTGRQKVAEVASIYYFGRVDARLSGDALRRAILDQGKSMSAASAGPAMTACARTMQQRRLAFQSLGQSLAASAVKAAPRPPAKK